MLISETYRELNRKLHAKGNYGRYGERWKKMVDRLMIEHSCKTVLDYGCGQGELGKLFGNPDWFHEYDPAIEGKEVEPPQSDLVVCTDVLEHIEPEFLEAVLAHLSSRARNVLLLNIATCKAGKVLEDGRNAHLIVQDPIWWQEQLEQFFKIESFNVHQNEVFFIARRQIKIEKELKSKSAVSSTIRADNMRLNCPRTTGRIFELPPHDLTAILCCYGPSLRDTWPQARERKEAGKARIVTVSGAHDFMIQRGMVPDYHLECDPREHKCTYTKNPHRDTKYWVASCVHPKMLNQLPLEHTYLWHAYDEESFKILNEVDPGNQGAIAGGGSIGLRAMMVLYVSGFRRFEIHGMDCSFDHETRSKDGEPPYTTDVILQHAGEHAGKPMSITEIRCGDRWFKTSLAMVTYATYFRNQVNIMQRTSEAKGEPALNERGDRVLIEMHGDGLLQEKLRQEAILEPDVAKVA